MVRAVQAPATQCEMIWGASKNSRMTWWRDDDRARIGWAPEDSADPYAAQLAGKTSGDPIAERYQGGTYAAMDYSRP